MPHPEVLLYEPVRVVYLPEAGEVTVMFTLGYPPGLVFAEVTLLATVHPVPILLGTVVWGHLEERR